MGTTIFKMMLCRNYTDIIPSDLMVKKQLSWGVLYIIFWIKKRKEFFKYVNWSRQLGCKDYNHNLNHIKYYDGKFKQKFSSIFSKIMVADYGTCDHDLWKEIKILLKMSLAISQVKASKIMFKEICNGR